MKWVLITVAVSGLASFTGPKPVKPAFPQTWSGEWSGPCFILQGADTLMKFNMNVFIKALVKDSLYDFHIQYADQEVRPYRLVRGSQPGSWITDEMNSILLPGYYHDGHYIEFFQVDNTLLRSDFELSGKVLKVRIESWKTDKRVLTGDSITGNTIWNYPPGSVQFGLLKRKKPTNK